MSFNNNYIDEDLSTMVIEEHCNIDEKSNFENKSEAFGDSERKNDFSLNNTSENQDLMTPMSNDESVSDEIEIKHKEDEKVTEDLPESYIRNVDIVEEEHETFSNINIDIPTKDEDIKEIVLVNESIKEPVVECISDELILEKELSVSNHSDSHASDFKESDEILSQANLEANLSEVKVSDTAINDTQDFRLQHDVPNISSETGGSINTDDINAGINKISCGDAYDPANDPDTFIDILGNGLLTKRVLVKGMGRETRPTHGDSVTIEYKAWNSQDELFAEATETFVIGDGDMIQAFDLALCLAEIKEEFELKTDSRFAYGSRGMTPDVKPDETLKYHIKLLSSEDAPDYSTYNYTDRMSAADKKRERGNYLYRREEFSYAVNSYSRAIKIIETDPDFKKSYKDESKADMFDLFVKVTNNLAASQLKLESYDSVIETCQTILSYDPDNVKALFRKGKGLVAKGSYGEAYVVLRQAFDLDKTNKLIANEIQKCMQLKKHEDEKSARFCRRIFGGGDSSKQASGGESGEASAGGWRPLLYKYSPYVGAILATGLSILLATVAIAKSKPT